MGSGCLISLSPDPILNLSCEIGVRIMIKEYIKAQNVAEAVQALNNHLPWGRIIAGGTDILSKTATTRYQADKPYVYIDIKGISEFRQIRRDDDWLIIGPVVTLHELIDNHIIAADFPALTEAASQVGSYEIRNRATVGGNIGSKSANADLLVPLIGIGAVIEVCDIEGRREMLLDELLGSGLTKLGRRMIITAIKIPVRKMISYGYRRWTRESMGRAFLSTVVFITQEEQAESVKVTVTAGGTGLWPRRGEAILTKADVCESQSEYGLIKPLNARLDQSISCSEAYQQQLLEVLIDEAFIIAGKEIIQ